MPEPPSLEDPVKGAAVVLEHETDGDALTEAAPIESARIQHVTAAPEGAAAPLLAGRYEILGMLGSGGMGTVYRARDRELDEHVALKILKKELASSSGMLERFRREVKLARRVTHKNVARTFDIGEDGGDRFLTMELVEGEMLGSHLARRGRLPWRDVVAIGRDVCAGLAAAHAAGVLHRDLKPENVIIARDGRTVITDFGIARAVTQGEHGRTGGGIIGTPAYMAPEQVEGASDLDGRADLYALGTMLYELLTGKAAWPGDSAFSIAAARLLRPPPDVRAVAPEVPEPAAEVVLKLMARHASDRYASAEETSEALAALATTTAPSGKSLPPDRAGPMAGASPGDVRAKRKTIAVLPVVNLGLEDDAYLVQSVTEDLVDLLSMVRELRVRPRGDTARFDKASRDVREVGRDLGVDVVVDGSLRRMGEVVRVSVRLVTVEDGFQLWARRFDRPAAQVLTVADEAAAAVAHALAAALPAAALPAEARAVVGDDVAQDLYLRGRFLIHRGWFDVSRDGVAMLREAHNRAPNDTRIAGTYALALARLRAMDPAPATGTNEAQDLAERALRINPAQSEARVALGFLQLHYRDSVEAANELKRALVLAPNCVEALDLVGRVLCEVGHTGLGLRTLRRALAIEPMLHARDALARTQFLLGDLDAAFETLGPVPLEAGDFSRHMLNRGRMLLAREDRTEARALAKLIEGRVKSEYSRRSLEDLYELASTGVLSPRLAAGLDTGLAIDPRFPPRRRCFHAQLRTEIRLAGGDPEGALAELRAADESGLLDLLWLDRLSSLEPLRGRPEFLAVRASTAARAARVGEILAPNR